MTKLQLMSSNVCPFAQRTLIVLKEKQLDYEHIEIDLTNKPHWFEDVSPYSKVPLLIHNTTKLYESSIINEYLDEEFGVPPMMPISNEERAKARIWIDFDNTKFIPLFYKILLTNSEIARKEYKIALQDAFMFIESHAFKDRGKGSYWLGNFFSLVDAAIYPHFERLGVLEHYRGVSLPNECGAIRDWLKAVSEHSSVSKSSHQLDFHIEAYSDYADGSAHGTTAKDMRL